MLMSRAYRVGGLLFKSQISNLKSLMPRLLTTRRLKSKIANLKSKISHAFQPFH